MSSDLSISNRIIRDAWRLAPQRTLSEVIGWYSRWQLPAWVQRRVLAGFVRQHGIDVSEAEKDLSQYASLAEFFTRKLKPGQRPIDSDPASVVSPADGKVVSCGRVEAGSLLEVKGRRFSLAQLLADDAAAARLEVGSYLVTYLSPRDYHRVHAPVAGQVLGYTEIPGELFPVNARSVLSEPALFARNERMVTYIEGDFGLCAVVMVAAVGVGHITAAYDAAVGTHAGILAELYRKKYNPAQRPVLAKGAELGTFHLGSTTVVVFEHQRVSLETFAPGMTTFMGKAIGQGSRL